MSSENLSQKINLILCDLPPGITQSDIESFLSPYKSNFDSININEANPPRATVEFKDLDIANKCRHELNQKKLKNKNIRIMREEKNFLMKNKDTKNNLYVKNIPKGKDPRELYEYFLKFGDVFSLKVNENEKGEFTGTAFLTYYKEQDAKKCIEETNNKKIWDSDIEVNYQKNTHDKGYSHNNNYHNNYTNNYYNKSLKINISNLPENYTDKEVTKLCEEFGKFEICDIRKNKYGKFAIVKFSKEAEMKSAIEKLNNKSIEKNKLLVKELHHSNNSHNNNYSNYSNNYYGKQRPTNLPFFYPNISMNINNIPMQKYEDTLINNNLYVTNIPQRATKEDFEKTFGQFGEIESTKLDEDTTITKDAKDKQQFFNKGFGYISFKKVEDAKKALESLDGKYIKGFENHYKRLSVEYFIPKDKRNPMTQGNFIQMSSGSVLYPNLPGQYMPQQYMVPIPMIPNNQMRMYNNKGGFKNMGYGNRRYNNNYKNRGNRANKNNQKRNNNTANKNMNNNKKEEEKKVEFDQETFDKLKTEEEKNEFLGEKIFNLIQENRIIKEKNADEDVIGKITGMILGIQNKEEIIDILKSPSRLEERIKEAYVLFEKNK